MAGFLVYHCLYRNIPEFLASVSARVWRYLLTTFEGTQVLTWAWDRPVQGKWQNGCIADQGKGETSLRWEFRANKSKAWSSLTFGTYHYEPRGSRPGTLGVSSQRELYLYSWALPESLPYHLWLHYPPITNSFVVRVQPYPGDGSSQPQADPVLVKMTLYFKE